MKRAWLIVLIGVLIFAGFTFDTPAQTPKRGGTLTIGFKEEPDRLDARYPGAAGSSYFLKSMKVSRSSAKA